MSDQYKIYRDPNIVDLLLIKRDLESGKSVLLSFNKDIASRHSMIINNPLLLNTIYFNLIKSSHEVISDQLTKEIYLLNKTLIYYHNKYKELLHSQRTRFLTYEFKFLFSILYMRFNQGYKFSGLENLNRSYLYSFQNTLNFNDIVIREIFENREKYKERFKVHTYDELNPKDKIFDCDKFCSLIDYILVGKEKIFYDKDSNNSPFENEVVMQDYNKSHKNQSRVNLLSVTYNSNIEDQIIKENVYIADSTFDNAEYIKDTLKRQLYISFSKYCLSDSKKGQDLTDRSFKDTVLNKISQIKRNISSRYNFFTGRKNNLSNHNFFKRIYKPSVYVKDNAKFNDFLKFIEDQKILLSEKNKTHLRESIDYSYQELRDRISYKEYKFLVDKYNIEKASWIVKNFKRDFYLGSKTKKLVFDSEIKYLIEDLYLKRPIDYFLYRHNYLRGSKAGRDIMVENGIKLDQYLQLSKCLDETKGSKINNSKNYLFKQVLIYYSLINKPL